MGERSEAGRVQIVEVGPRDGLQNESTPVSTADKVALIERSISAGLRRIEATSFVHPGRVPQMADAEQVMAAVPRVDGVSYIGLVLNERGFDRAVAAGVNEVNVVVIASETFSQRNQCQGIEESLATAERIIAAARAGSLATSVTIGASFGCPFEGEVPAERVVAMVDRLAQTGVEEIALADTIGVGVPAQVTYLAGELARVAPGVGRRFHFHNTRNTGYANAITAVAAGVTVLDSSTGGIGGCPFAPDATGNIATEDLVYLLERSGLPTGVDLPQVMETAQWMGDLVGHPIPGQLSRAGSFPATEPV